MLTFGQMENYYQLLQLIEKYQQKMRGYDITLRAKSYDGTPATRSHSNDQIGDTVVSREGMQNKLHQLKQLRDRKRPDVEATVRAMASVISKNRFRAEMILTMHYLNGRELLEIADILHMSETDVKTVIMKLFKKI